MSNPYDFTQAPNIAGAGNYAQMLQQGIGGVFKQQQKQQGQKQPQAGGPPSVFTSPFLGGSGGQGQNYIAALLKSLGGS